MEVLVLGINHKTAPLELREKLSIPCHKAPDLMQSLAQRRIFDERLVLSTCNRTEIYGAGRSLDGSVKLAKEFLSEYSKLDLPTLEDKFYILRQPDAVEHLFKVASGLDSMVIGETEIIGQVKDAYLTAQKHQQTGKVLNALFQRSLKVAKDLRTHTDIGAGRVSIASVAVDLAKKIFGSLDNTHVTVLGTGEMAGQVTKAMIAKGAKAVLVSSRHYDRAQMMARELGAEALSFENYENRIGQTDILIASTHAPTALVQESQIKAWMRLRHQKPLFLVDVAVPRNIEPSAEKLDNVYLYNIDDLQAIASENAALRKGEVEECARRIGQQKQYFMNWLKKEFYGTSALKGNNPHWDPRQSTGACAGR